MSISRPELPAVEPTYDPSRPFPNVQTLYNTPIPNCPGMSIVTMQVSLQPHASTPPHTHAGAFLAGHVLSGYVFNKMNDAPMKLYGPGEHFFENPGCRHRISDNASATEPAVMIASMIVETEVVNKVGVGGLIVIDEEYRAMVEEAQTKKA